MFLTECPLDVLVFPHPPQFLSLLPFPHCLRPHFFFLNKKAALALILPFSVFLLFHLVQPVCHSFFPVPALSFCPCRETASITEYYCNNGHYANVSFIPRIKKSHFLCQGQNTLYSSKCTSNAQRTSRYSAHLNSNYCISL